VEIHRYNCHLSSYICDERINHTTKLFVVAVTDSSDSNYCFKSYSEKHSACRGHLHVRVDRNNIDDCCNKGQGYAVEVL